MQKNRVFSLTKEEHIQLNNFIENGKAEINIESKIHLPTIITI